MKHSLRHKSPEYQNLERPVKELLQRLASLSEDAPVAAGAVPHRIDRNLRTLFLECAHQLRNAQMVYDRATVTAADLNARAAEMFEEASEIVSCTDEQMARTHTFTLDSEEYAANRILRANTEAIDVLEAASELSESHEFHEAIGIDAVKSWISEKAANVATAMISDIETMTVDIGFHEGQIPDGPLLDLPNAA